MIEIGKTLISRDVINKEFVCNLSKCKGACCVEGDLGAPLEEEETHILEEIYGRVRPYLSEESRAVIEDQGAHIIDDFNERSTPLMKGGECAYVVYDEHNTLKCGIEQAYLDGKTDFKKPISCHLYPVRTVELLDVTGVNYDVWSICSDACVLGEELKVPVYKFLKEPLIRRFGKDWWTQLDQIALQENKD